MHQIAKSIFRRRPRARMALHTLALATAVLAGGAAAQTVTTTLDFVNRPVPPVFPYPQLFDMAGPMQTFSEPNRYTLSGGVILDNPIFLPAFGVNGLEPGLYGTSDLGDPSLLDTISLVLPSSPGFGVTSVRGLLFNGQPIAETYNVSFFTGTSGQSLLFTQTFTDMLAATDSSAYGNFSFTSTLANPITRVTIGTPNAGINGWDFFVDTIVISAVPEPSPASLAVAGVAVLLLAGRRQRRLRR